MPTTNTNSEPNVRAMIDAMRAAGKSWPFIAGWLSSMFAEAVDDLPSAQREYTIRRIDRNTVEFTHQATKEAA